MSSISCGIVGLPNVGKSTIFNTLTKAQALVANYPFATIEPNVGIVNIPDRRLDKLAQLYDTEKIVPATVSFTDIAGLVAGASTGAGLGNQFLSHIRTCSTIVHVVRAFEDNNVTHVEAIPDPKRDIDIINTELCLADHKTLTNHLVKLEKEAKADPKLKPMLELCNKAISLLNDGKTLNNYPEFKELKELNLITLKPVLYLFNLDENGLTDSSLQMELKQIVAPQKATFICAKLESELIDLTEVDQLEFLSSYNQSEPSLSSLIKDAYNLLGLHSYLTAGKKEVRAWTIPIGAKAPQAAGVIHSDFEKGFIAAEVVKYDDLIECGSISQARASGKARLEGKEYVVKDDDVIEFRFNKSK